MKALLRLKAEVVAGSLLLSVWMGAGGSHFTEVFGLRGEPAPRPLSPHQASL